MVDCNFRLGFQPTLFSSVMRHVLLLLVLLVQTVASAPREIDAYRWEGVERIVAIGDVHGDYDNYIQTLRAAGLVNQRGRWIGGSAHLVQVGDVPDRGPDTLRIIRHLSRLANQARRAGGRVHHLIGNHEAMNVIGDLRYVSPGEYEAFVTRDSPRVRDRYFDALMDYWRSEEPERYAGLPEDFRAHWELTHPLGWVEHRLAWDPFWNRDGELFLWVLSSPVAVQLNELIFVHGGISADYCRFDLAELTSMVHEALQREQRNEPSVLDDETGPLWYRGLAGMPPETDPGVVEAILERYGARHIVIGHTPTNGIIWPRYHAGVVMVDVGMAAYYGGHIAWLEVSDGRLIAGYPDGRLDLPLQDDERLGYLDQVIELQPDIGALRLRRQQLLSQEYRAATKSGSAPGNTVPDQQALICGNDR